MSEEKGDATPNRQAEELSTELADAKERIRVLNTKPFEQIPGKY